jgi:hypothetical protein
VLTQMARQFAPILVRLGIAIQKRVKNLNS